MYDGTRQQLLDRIEAGAASCYGYSVGNPRYFAEMFAGCLAANPSMEFVALECIAAAVEVCAERQSELDRASVL